MRYYIIMADIIHSSHIPGRELMDKFKQDVAAVNEKFSANIKSPLSITLGDEFQGVVDDLSAAMEIIFYLDQRLLKVEPGYCMRYVVNYGCIDTPISKQNAYGMLGEGLTHARSLLEELKETDREILMEGLAEPKQTMLNMALKLYRSFYNDWRKDDRAVAAYFLEVGDYKKVAAAFHRDPSTMWRREKSLKMDEFKTSRNLITALINA